MRGYDMPFATMFGVGDGSNYEGIGCWLGGGFPRDNCRIVAPRNGNLKNLTVSVSRNTRNRDGYVAVVVDGVTVDSVIIPANTIGLFLGSVITAIIRGQSLSFRFNGGSGGGGDYDASASAVLE